MSPRRPPSPVAGHRAPGSIRVGLGAAMADGSAECSNQRERSHTAAISSPRTPSNQAIASTSLDDAFAYPTIRSALARLSSRIPHRNHFAQISSACAGAADPSITPMASTSACVMSAVAVGSVAGAPRAQVERVATANNVLLSARRASTISGVALPPLARSSFRTEPKRSLTIVAAKATKEPESTVNETTAAAEDFLRSLQDAWDKSDDKPAIAGLVAAGLIGLWAAFGLIGAIEKLPLIPDLFEIVGILFSGWFVYRYLLFKPDREELLKLIDEQKAKITGQ